MKIHQGGRVHRMMKGLVARVNESDKSLKMLEVAIDNAFEGLIMNDPGGNILNVNQAHADFPGRKMAEI
jgi:PAS domain-containing protein